MILRTTLNTLTFILISIIPNVSLAQSLVVHPVTNGIWAIVGEHSQRSPENLGNNATFGLIVTEDGVVLIDPGGSYTGAAALDQAIQTVTDLPVTHVVNTGGQDHRWLGNFYWQEKGALVIASDAAIEDQRARSSMQMSMLSQLLGDALAGTKPVFADTSFVESYTLELGGLAIEIVNPGPAHTPGDSFVWVPGRSTVFSGDIIYTERLLAILDVSSISFWPEAFLSVEATGATHVIPGHGAPTTMNRARKDTFDYLKNLQEQIRRLIDDGGDILKSPNVEQSAFSYLQQFETLAGRNAQQAYQQMEWD